MNGSCPRSVHKTRQVIRCACTDLGSDRRRLEASNAAAAAPVAVADSLTLARARGGGGVVGGKVLRISIRMDSYSHVHTHYLSLLIIASLLITDYAARRRRGGRWKVLREPETARAAPGKAAGGGPDDSIAMSNEQRSMSTLSNQNQQFMRSMRT